MLLKTGGNIDIIDGGIVHKIVSNILNKYFDEVSEDKVKEAINNISLYKTSRLPLNEFKASISKEIFEEILETYEGYKKENNKYDFDDLCIKVLELLKSNKNLCSAYQKL